MRLSPKTADRLVDAFTARLAGGSLVIYAGARPNELGPSASPRLVAFPLPSPAFLPAQGGSAIAHPIDLAIIDGTGDATWAQFFGSDGSLLADASVGMTSDQDVMLTSTNLVENGTVELMSWTLRLPLQAGQ